MAVDPAELEKAQHDAEIIVTTIGVTMNRRWLAQFLGMLKKIEHNGAIGHSSWVMFHADGDADCRPKFTLAKGMPEPAEGNQKRDWGLEFDAG